jgi:hypothetical protein
MKIGNVLVVKYYLPLLGAVKPRNAVKQTGFTRPVGTDNSHQFAGINVKINILHGRNAAKIKMQIFNFQLGFFIFFSPTAHY